MSSRSKKDSFKKGDRVSARWSGSNIFYDAKVLDVTSRNYKVQYDDGSISSIKFSDVKKLTPSKETPPKTTKQSKSRSRSRSGGRQPRSRSRSRSPARREKKTTKNEKKSPKEDKKKVKEETTVAPNSNSLPSKVSRESVDGILSKTVLTRERVGASQSETTTVTTFNSFSKDRSQTHEGSTSSERPRSARLAALRKAQAEKISNAIVADKLKYSDDEEEEEEVEELAPSGALSTGWKTFYFLATFFKMVLTPALLLFLVFSCTKRQCTVLSIPQFYAGLREFYNSVKYPLPSVFAFHLLQILLALVPLGRRVPSETEKNFCYRLNGLAALFFPILLFGGGLYFNINSNWAYDKFRPIAMSCALYSIACAVALHIYALVKGDGTTQTKVPLIGKFYNGSFINPVLFGKVDLKTSFIRAGLIGSVLLNLSIVAKYFFMKKFVTVPLALTSGMQIFFVLDLFFREEKWLTTATYTTDSLGFAFILTFGFLVPIGLALQNVYLFTFEAKSAFVPHWCSGAIACLFILGYYIYLTSTNLKHNFRTNPFSPSYTGLVSIPTSKQKRRLIASGLWGLVRHPNYLGLLIMAVAWTLPCGFSHVVPFGPLVLLAIALVVRSFRIEAECQEKYGPAWKNYAEKVRSRFIPYIF